jgi:hypothetical protein
MISWQKGQIQGRREQKRSCQDDKLKLCTQSNREHAERTPVDDRRPDPRKERTKRCYQDDHWPLTMHPIQPITQRTAVLDDRRPNPRKERTKKGLQGWQAKAMHPIQPRICRENCCGWKEAQSKKFVARMTSYELNPTETRKECCGWKEAQSKKGENKKVLQGLQAICTQSNREQKGVLWMKGGPIRERCCQDDMLCTQSNRKEKGLMWMKGGQIQGRRKQKRCYQDDKLCIQDKDTPRGPPPPPPTPVQ